MDFVHPATTHDDQVVTLHSLLDRDVYRGGAIVVGPVRRGRGRRRLLRRDLLPRARVEHPVDDDAVVRREPAPHDQPVRREGALDDPAALDDVVLADDVDEVSLLVVADGDDDLADLLEVLLVEAPHRRSGRSDPNPRRDRRRALVERDGVAVHGQLALREALLRIEVTDARGERLPPAPGTLDLPGSEAELGRGLLIVGALADRWGIDVGPVPRKTVWAELDLAP